MFCLKCGKSIPDQSAFCLYCGTKMPRLATDTDLPVAVAHDELPSLSGTQMPRLAADTDLPVAVAYDELPSFSGTKMPRLATDTDLPVAVAYDEPPSFSGTNTPYSTADADLLAAAFEGLPPFSTAPSGTSYQPEIAIIPDNERDTLASQTRACSVCGRLLPETSISEVCVTCLNNRNFVAVEPMPEEDNILIEGVCDQLPANAADTIVMRIAEKPSAFHLDLDLDSEYPTAYAEPPAPSKQRKLSKWLLTIPAAVLVICLVIALPHFLPLSGSLGALVNGSSSQAPSQSNVERKVISYAHTIVKVACVNPESVVFSGDAVAVEEGGAWNVTETFDRTSRQGEFVTTTYTAVFRMDSTKDEGYAPVKLRIDDTMMYDYT